MSKVTEITRDELHQHPFMLDRCMVEKAYLLANGMVKVHGYEKEQAIGLALKLARNWFKTNGEYTIKLK